MYVCKERTDQLAIWPEVVLSWVMCSWMQIQQLWSEVLELERISCSANFFQIGGTSLLAVMLASRMQTAFGLQVPASQIFTSKTISELAEFVSQSSPVSSSNAGSNQQPVISNERLSAAQKAQGVYCTLNQEVMILSHQLASRPSAFSMPFFFFL